MIVSHEHKFIYIKAFKVAGSSVLHSLAQQCARDDRVAQPVELRKKKRYERNLNGLRVHSLPVAIRQDVGKEIWNSYTKIAVTRNPWDCLVSMYWFGNSKKNRVRHKKHKKAKERVGDCPDYVAEFRRFVAKTHFANPFNRNHLFWNRNDPVADIYLRFESLQDDYNKLCRKLKLRVTELPRLKSKYRKPKLHYSEYYDDASIEVVRKKWKWEIEFFNYHFDDRRF